MGQVERKGTDEARARARERACPLACKIDADNLNAMEGNEQRLNEHRGRDLLTSIATRYQGRLTGELVRRRQR